MSTKTLSYQLTCKFSGLPIGMLSYQVVAGHMPYLSHWDNMVAMHPVFSMETGRLLAFARGEWNRLAKAAIDNETTTAEESILQVSFLAVLHSLGSIDQQVPGLPPMNIVQSNMNRLFSLAFWHHRLDSQRFKFPRYKISKINDNNKFTNISDYLDICFDKKVDYEEGVEDLAEQERVISAEKALKALRNSWIVPIGNKALWRWVSANLPEQYEAEKQGWMLTLFTGNERTILDFDKDEIILLEEIVVSECPRGNAIMFAVRERLEKILKIYTDNKEAFTVDFTDYEEDEAELAFKEANGVSTIVEAPKLSDFPNKVAYIKANALWYLQQRAKENKAIAASIVPTIQQSNSGVF